MSGPGPQSLQANSIRSGSTLPSSPAVGAAFIKTGSSPGLYSASAAGVWTGPYSSGGITDAGGANNVLLKRTGVNQVGDSRITDDGSTTTIGNPAGNLVVVDNEITGTLASTLRFLNAERPGDFVVLTLGDYSGGQGTKIVNNDETKTITATASTESLSIDGVAHTITAATANGGVVHLGAQNNFVDISSPEAENHVNLNALSGAIEIHADVITNIAATSISNVTPLWGVGDNGTRFLIANTGRITKYSNQAPADGELLIGDTALGQFTKTTLTAVTPINISNNAGGISIGLDTANSGAPLSVLVANTVLATATGTVYSSPGNDSAALSIGTEGNVSWACPRAGTIRNLYIRTGGTAKVNTPATVITVRKNGVDTTLTVTMTQTVNTTTSDTTHSFTVAAGDLITVSFSTTGVAGVSTSIAGVSFLLN